MTSKPEPPRVDRSALEPLDPRVWKVAAVVFLGPLMTQLDSTVVNVSLSSISQDLHASIDSVQWIVAGYLLALALTLPLNAWLVDRLGAKRLYLVCFSAFTLASLLCGLERTIHGLIWARVIQGMAGGLLAPMAQMMLAHVAGKHLARVMGYIAMPVLIAPLLGPVVAGVILKYAGWPWLFYINLPVGIVAVFLAIFLLPGDKAPRRARPFDFFGFLLISPGLGSLLYGLDHSSTLEGGLFLLSGVILVGAFVWHAIRKNTEALIDLRLFTNRVFSIGATTQFLNNGASYAGQMLIPLFLMTGFGISPANAGWMLAPMGLGMMLIYPSLGFLTDRFGCRAVSAGGALLATVTTLPFLWMAQNRLSPSLLALSLLVRGVGQGAIGVPSMSAAYISVPREQLAIATTASNIVQRLGGPTATTIVGMVLSFSASHFAGSGAHAFTLAFVALIGLQVILLGSAGRLPIRIQSNSPDGPTEKEN
jgi:EmrB/QacA subfamily drug resistance transporter